MKTKTLIADQAVIENKKIISPAVITIENGIITKVSETVPKSLPDNSLELKDMILLPGFVNAHCHLELTDIGPLVNKDFVPWIKELVQKKQKMEAYAIKKSVLNGVEMLISSGVTTIFDHISFNTPLSVYNDMIPRIIGFGEAIGAISESADLILHNLKIMQKSSPIPFYISPHAIHSLAPSALKTVFENEPKPFSIHLGESQAELEYFESYSGDMANFIKERCPHLKSQKPHDAKTPFEYIRQNDWDMHKSLIIHANFINDSDLDTLKNWENCCVVHCPGSFEFFRHRQFPFRKIAQQNISIAIGTDSLASNNRLNFLNEIQLFLTAFPDTDLFDLLPMITTNSCKAIGLENVGEIAEGNSADIIGFINETDKPILEILKSRDHVDYYMAIGSNSK